MSKSRRAFECGEDTECVVTPSYMWLREVTGNQRNPRRHTARTNKKGGRREMEEEEMETAALFGGEDARFDDVEIDGAELPASFSISLLPREGEGEDEDDAVRRGDVPPSEATDAEEKPAVGNDAHPLDGAVHGHDDYEDDADDGSGSAHAGVPPRRSYQCQYAGCPKFAQAGGLCIAHGGGYKCQTPFCAFFNLRTCPDHGGSKRCSVTGCTRVALGVSALCCAHGGGRKCSVKKCEKYDAGRGFCLAHGGGRACRIEGCTKKQIRYGFCSGHGGRARCKVDGCDKYDRGQGKCKMHGGGYFCKVDGCTKKDKGGGFCASHGGGKKCYVDGCSTPCVGGGRCKLHGGGRRCQFESGCRNWALNGGRCKEHGGAGKRCGKRGCDKHDQGGGYCLAHGGGYTCSVPGCTKKQVCVFPVAAGSPFALY